MITILITAMRDGVSIGDPVIVKDDYEVEDEVAANELMEEIYQWLDHRPTITNIYPFVVRRRYVTQDDLLSMIDRMFLPERLHL